MPKFSSSPNSGVPHMLRYSPFFVGSLYLFLKDRKICGSHSGLWPGEPGKEEKKEGVQASPDHGK